MITVESTGSFKSTEDFLKRMAKSDIAAILSRYGKEGVAALSSHTPFESGLTAASWDYTVEVRRGVYSITWFNTNLVGGIPVAILLQYGHGTGTGGYVQGQDFINPAMKPIFDKIAEDVWKAVTKA